jgi:hypothetical protein
VSDDLLRSHGQVLIHVLRRALPEDSLHPCSGPVHVAVLNRGQLLVRDGGTPEGDDHLPVLEPLGVERESGLETLVQLTPGLCGGPEPEGRPVRGGSKGRPQEVALVGEVRADDGGARSRFVGHRGT